MLNKNNKIKFTLRLKDWLKKVGVKFIKVILSITFSVTIGLIIRYLIHECLDIDIVRDYLNPISILYYFFMVIFSKFLHQVLIEYLIDILVPNFMMPAGGGEEYGNVPSSSNIPPSSSSGNNNNGPPRNVHHPPLNNPNGGLITDNQELPPNIRSPDWNYPEPETIPYGTQAFDYSARLSRGEPMDIAIPTTEDKQHIHRILSYSNIFIRTKPDCPRNVTLSHLLETLRADGYATRGPHEDPCTFVITKQIRKIIYNEPQFNRYINPNTNRVMWTNISAGPNSEFMNYLSRNN